MICGQSTLSIRTMNLTVTPNNCVIENGFIFFFYANVSSHCHTMSMYLLNDDEEVVKMKTSSTIWQECAVIFGFWNRKYFSLQNMMRTQMLALNLEKLFKNSYSTVFCRIPFFKSYFLIWRVVPSNFMGQRFYIRFYIAFSH